MRHHRPDLKEWRPGGGGGGGGGVPGRVSAGYKSTTMNTGPTGTLVINHQAARGLCGRKNTHPGRRPEVSHNLPVNSNFMDGGKNQPNSQAGSSR